MVILQFIVGFFLLIKGADILVDAAANLAKKLNVSNLVIGLTIISFGTSLPELIVNVNASFSEDASEGIAIGTIIGSNIANILLVLGAASLFYPLKVKKNTYRFEIPFSLIITLLVLIFVNLYLYYDGVFQGLSRLDGIILLILQFVFMFYVFKFSTRDAEEEEEEVTSNLMSLLLKKLGVSKNNLLLKQYKKVKEILPKSNGKETTFKTTYLIIAGIIGLAVGGKWTVEGAVMIAEYLEVSQEFIAFSVIAIGTCLPEIVTSVVSALKRNVDFAVGNVVGSLIFNVLWVLGLSAVIRPIPFFTGEAGTQINHDIFILIGATLLLLGFIVFDKNRTITRGKGIVFLLIYFAYIGYLVWRDLN
jgi:cation:H+ antiporter